MYKLIRKEICHDIETRTGIYFRKLKGISQMKLAETIGISRTHMSNIEAPNMPTSVSLETLMDIADALDIPAYVLLSFHSDVEIDTPSV